MSDAARPAAQLSEEEMRAIGGLIVETSPHAISLGMRMIEVGPGRCLLEAPYDESFVGDPETGVIHGGVATALLDHACGVAAALGMTQDGAPVTLDLRIDYFRTARPGRSLVASARCVKVTHNVAFVSALAHDGDPDDPVASAASSFVIPGNAPGRKDTKADAGKKGEGA